MQAASCNFPVAGHRRGNPVLPLVNYRQTALVIVTLVPGADRDAVLHTLQDRAAAASNIRSVGSSQPTRDWLTACVSWANATANMLRGQVIQADINRLVWTARHQVLASKTGMLHADLENSGVNAMIDAELDNRVIELQAAHTELQRRIASWSVAGTFVAFDSSAYINAPKLEDIRFGELLGLAAPDGPVRLLVPMAVVDELDNLKQHNRPHHRWRAGYTTAVLARLLRGDPTAPALLHHDNPAVTVELLPDPPGHIRLPITDDEIVDRLVHAQVLAGRAITLITFDTGQDLRASAAGLQSLRLRNAVEDEPEPDQQPIKRAARV